MSDEYTKEEREEVRRKKTDEYGGKEYFAVPSLRSYPLTKNGKPSKERTLAAWRYIHQEKNMAKLGEHAESAISRIKAFAKKHFDLELEAGDKKAGSETKKSVKEVYLLPEISTWPITKGLKPDATLCNVAWQEMHLVKSQAILGDELLDLAERRLLWFADKHGIKLENQPNPTYLTI